MTTITRKSIVSLAFCLITLVVTPARDNTARAETPAETARRKIDNLNALIVRAEATGVDALKERMTVRTAEVFLKYADWDEANTRVNADHFRQTAKYRKVAQETAETLPDFERREVILMLDEATQYLIRLIAGEVSRKPIPNIDWSQVVHDGDQLSFEGRPVFLTDWTWKPDIDELNEYHGQQDGFFLMHPYVEDKNGKIRRPVVEQLKEKPDGRLGFVFLNHKNAPAWARQEYGPGFVMREDTYTAYDIDHPGARELNRLLLAGTVPYMTGKKYRELGYMLCNEPHFFTKQGVWATGPVSAFTIGKFQQWLRKRHGTIDRLNHLWQTGFTDFDAVDIDIPIDTDLQGTPKWFDWVSFNMDRVTDWYAFLKEEIRKHDAQAKVHLKIMPNLWTDNWRDHGIDIEALTRISDIIGNDAGAEYNLMWGRGEWQERYAFGWREMSMGYDFLKSVSPGKIMYNTELHFLSTVRSRDLHMDPLYVRATFWLAHTQGLTVSQNWFWARREDGSIRANVGNGYGGSNNQQPRIVNEVHSTMMDLNCHAEEIMAMQRQRKPIRIFYSKTSAINKPHHMDDVFDLYESLFFEGIPLGFVTRDILQNEDHSDWDVVLVHKTEYVTADERKALQDYVDRGGRIIIDDASLAKDEYGRPIQGLRDTGRVLRAESLEDVKSATLRYLAGRLDRQPNASYRSVDNGPLPLVAGVVRDSTILDVSSAEAAAIPPVIVEERNSGETKGCAWKWIRRADGTIVLSIVNLGTTDAELSIKSRQSAQCLTATDLLTAVSVSLQPVLKPYELLFVELSPTQP
jgi:beta-galactosidase